MKRWTICQWRCKSCLSKQQYLKKKSSKKPRSEHVGGIITNTLEIVEDNFFQPDLEDNFFSLNVIKTLFCAGTEL